MATPIKMEDSDWRSTRNLYETLIEINENLNFTIWQLEEMSIADSMMMLMEMRQNDTEISGSHLWTGSYLLAKVFYSCTLLLVNIFR